MDTRKCLEDLCQIRYVSIATVDDYFHPQIRTIEIMDFDNNQLCFLTARGKDFYNQLLGNGRIALLGLKDQIEMIRIYGTAKPLPSLVQQKLIDKIFSKNDHLKIIYPGRSRYVLEVFCIYGSDFERLKMERGQVYREESIAGHTVFDKGYCLPDDCIQCGVCAENCPSDCIEPGCPYTIIQSNCLRCGLCIEVCPVSDINLDRFLA